MNSNIFNRYFSSGSISVLLHADPCSDFECPRGSACKVYEPTNEAFCDPSCELDNGGCNSNQACELDQVNCVRAPCPPEVVCTDVGKTVVDQMLI